MLTRLFLTLALLGAAPAPLLAAPAPHALAIDQVDDLIDAGRAKLLEGDLDAASAQFEAAAAADSSWRTRLWTLRVLAAKDPASALGEIDREKRGGRTGAEVDYLFGVAFAAQADAGGGTAALAYGDAMRFLQTALAAEPQRFADAWPILAASARNAGDNQVSFDAASRAVSNDPKSTVAYDLRGRAALALFAARASEDPRPSEVKELYKAAVESFSKITELLRRPEGRAQEATVAGAWYQLGNTYVFGEDLKSASKAFGEAMGWDPEAVDIGSVNNLLGEKFVDAAEFGIERFVGRNRGDLREATLQWWYGWAVWNSGGDLEDAEAALERTLAIAPQYTNTYYFLMRTRYDQQVAAKEKDRDFTAAIEALSRYRRADPQGVVGMLQSDASNVAILEFLVGWSATRDLVAASTVSGLLTDLEPQNAKYWNDHGLFLRDSGDVLMNRIRQRRDRGEAVDPAEDRAIMDRWERSLAAYERAIELDPGNPTYYNDAGVVLHYNLQRDFERALSLYERSIELAKLRLDSGELTDEERAQFQQYVGWAENNRRLLLELMKGDGNSAGGSR